MFTTLLQAAQPEQGGALMSFLPLILIIVVCYFFMIRPQQKRQKELAALRSSLKKGDKVMTTSGLMAKVAEVKDDCVVLEIAEGVRASYDKQAIQSVTKQ